MPEVPKNHPAAGLITMNFIANGLGLDNAATPIGLKAMRSLQSLNPTPKIASNAQILFLVMNASSLTLLPVSIFMYRAQQGAVDPTLVFLPILLATSASTMAGFFSVAFAQRIKLNDPVVITWMLAIATLLSTFILFLSHLSAAALGAFSSLLGNAVIRELLHDEGFTIQGAKQRLSDKNFVKEVKQAEPPKELQVTKQGQVELPLENLNQSNSLAGLNLKSIKDELLSIIDLLKK